VKRFRYALDPLCVAACAVYLLNSLWWKRQFGGAFLHGQLNDLLLIPAALPWVLWLQRRCGLRADDGFPRWSEIALYVCTWSIVAELIAPRFVRATGDWRDAVAYTIGGVAAGAWWQRTARS